VAPDGSFPLADGLGLVAGIEHIVGYLAPPGHEVYRSTIRPMALIGVGTDRVGGCASPFTAVELVLQDEGGNERGRAEAEADTDGAFDGRLRDREGRALTAQPEDRLLIRTVQTADAAAVGFLTVTLTSDGIAGSFDGPFGATRDLALELLSPEGRPAFRTAREARPDGRFEWPLALLPPDVRIEPGLRARAFLRAFRAEAPAALPFGAHFLVAESDPLTVLPTAVPPTVQAGTPVRTATPTTDRPAATATLASQGRDGLLFLPWCRARR
jgi:hypothetical protein